MNQLAELCKAMIAYDKGDPRRIHHFLKVNAFAHQIGLEEGLDEKTLSGWRQLLTCMTSAFMKGRGGLAGMTDRFSRSWAPMKRGLCWKSWV